MITLKKRTNIRQAANSKAFRRLNNKGWSATKEDEDTLVFTKGDVRATSVDEACRLQSVEDKQAKEDLCVKMENHLLAHGWQKASFQHVNEKVIRISNRKEIRVVTSTHDIWRVDLSDDPTVEQYYYAVLRKAYAQQLKRDLKNEKSMAG